jgi:hypothetical protein
MRIVYDKVDIYFFLRIAKKSFWALNQKSMESVVALILVQMKGSN